MKKLHIQSALWFVTLLFTALASWAQNATAQGGEFRFGNTQCVTPEQSEAIKEHIRENQAQLRVQGILPELGSTTSSAVSTSFAWPLRPAAGFTDPGYYGISNYVDQNAAYPNALRDYNCGNRTYDQTNGYNHAGTDVYTWPFGQLKQQNNEVEIIAAAAGIIVDKNDGSADHSCAFCTSACLWNAVYIQHADGSVAWYGHMKNGSVTTKTIGQGVALGEKIGVVGSSGNSTGPHLHFEVYEDAEQKKLIDPWQGTCNVGPLFNANLKWANQKPYRESMINRIQVGKQAVNISIACPGLELPNVATDFSPGNTIYVTTFYHDQVKGAISTHKIIQPNGVVWVQWQHTAPDTYSSSYWFWPYVLPASPQNGTWTLEVTMGSQTVQTQFNVGVPTPISLLQFNATPTKPCEAKLDWTTATETNNKGFHIQRSSDGVRFENVGWVAGAGNSTGQKKYDFVDAVANTVADCNIAYYRLEQEDYDGKTSYSKAVAVKWGGTNNIGIYPNPAVDKITIKGENLKTATLLDATGRVLAQVPLQERNAMFNVSKLLAGTYLLRIVQKDGTETVQRFVKH